MNIMRGGRGHKMSEILGFEKDIKKGLSDVSAGRYRVIG
jgi:hypothetical protein